jgi:hypothetical protein
MPMNSLHAHVELARRDYAVMGAPIDIAAPEGILECIRIAAGEVKYASERIAGLEAGQAVGRPSSVLRRPRDLGREGESSSETVEEIRLDDPQLHVWIRVRHQAMDRLVRYCAAAIKAKTPDVFLGSLHMNLGVQLSDDQIDRIHDVLSDRPQLTA